MKGQDLARRGLFSTIVNIFISLLGLISLIFIKRYLGFEALGIIAFTSSFIGLFSFFNDLGLGTTHLKKVHDKSLDKAKCIGSLISLRLLLLCLSIIVLFYLYFVVLNYDESHSSLVNSVFLLSLFNFFIMTLISIQKNIIFPTLKFAQVGVPRTLTKVLQTLLKILMCFLGFGVQYLIGIEIFVGIILFFLLFKFTRKYPIKIPDRKHIRQYIEFSVKVFSIGIISALLFNIDKVMIEHFIGIEILGIFFLAQRTASILNIIPKKIVNLFVPRFSKLFEEANFEEISRLCRLSIKYQSYVILAIIGVLVIVANNLFFLLYGSDSLESVPVFIVLLISVYVYSITMPFSSQFISTGHTGIAFGINLSVLITNIVFNLFLIPDQIYGYQTLNYGIIGAAYSTVISLSVKFILSYIYAYKLTKSKLYNRIWLHWLAFLFPLIFIVLNKDIMDNILAVIFSSLAFILVFFGTLYLFNEFGKKEIRVYLNISNPKLMKKYMIDELNE